MSQSLLWRRLGYPRHDYLSGDQFVLGHELRRALDAASVVSLALILSEQRAAEPAYGSRGYELRASWLVETGFGLIADTRIAVGAQRYGGDNPFFGERREDGVSRIETQWSQRRWLIAGFTPVVLLSSTRNHSNLSLYRFRRDFAGIGITRQY